MRPLLDPSAPWPDIPQDLLERIEATYPPRCYDGREALEEHLQYAGVSAFAVYLRQLYEEQQEEQDDERAAQMALAALGTDRDDAFGGDISTVEIT